MYHYPVIFTHEKTGEHRWGSVLARDEEHATSISRARWGHVESKTMRLSLGSPVPMALYEVTAWGSFPAASNDDLMFSAEFNSLEEASTFLGEIRAGKHPNYRSAEISCVVLYEMGVGEWCGHPCRSYETEIETWRNPSHVPGAPDDDEWTREIANQAGMGLGCAGYNDMMGYSN